MKGIQLTSNDLCSTALTTLVFVCYQTLQMGQEVLEVRISMIPKKTLSTQASYNIKWRMTGRIRNRGKERCT
jgi:hypothetical protein